MAKWADEKARDIVRKHMYVDFEPQEKLSSPDEFAAYVDIAQALVDVQAAEKGRCLGHVRNAKVLVSGGFPSVGEALEALTKQIVTAIEEQDDG